MMLCNLMEDNQETSYPYWPTKEEQTEKYGNIIVTMQSKTAYGDYSVRKFNLQEDEVCGAHCGIKLTFASPSSGNHAFIADCGCILCHSVLNLLS